MEDSVKERLRLFLKNSNIKAVDFCKSIEVSSGFISGMRESIQPDKLKSIAIKYPYLSIGWLMTGEGEMFKTSEDTRAITAGRDVIGGIGNVSGSGNVIGNGHHVGIIPADYEKELVRAKAEIDILKKKVKEVEAQNKKKIEEILEQHRQEKEILNNMLQQAINDKDRAMNMLDKALDSKK
jgi:hypothetical protein